MTTPARNLVLIITLWLFINPVMQAQLGVSLFRNKPDTLYPLIHTAAEPSLAKVYNKLAFYHSFANADSSLYYAHQALELSRKYNDPYEEAMALRNIGLAHRLTGNYPSSISNLQQSLSMFEQSGDHRNTIFLTLDLGIAYYEANVYDRMITILESLEKMINNYSEREDIVSPLEKAIIYGLIGGGYRDAGIYDKGIKFFREYLTTAQDITVPGRAHWIYVKSMAETFSLAERYDSALKYTLLARTYFPENESKPLNEHSGFESSLGYLYLKLGMPDKAISNLKKACIIEQQRDGYFYFSITTLFLGDAYLSLGQKDSALYYYQLAKEVSKNVKKELNQEESDSVKQVVYSGYQYFFTIGNSMAREHYYKLMTRLEKRLTSYYKKINIPDSALIHNEALLHYKDSLNMATRDLEIRKLQIRFDTERIEKENILLLQENKLKEAGIRQSRYVIVLLIILAVFIIISGWIILRQSRMKNLHEKVMLEQKLLRAQMNPHFIFNSLASIQNFIIKQDDMNASIYLSHFSDLVRNILEHSAYENIPLEKEINTINNYLELQKLRFRDKFAYTISIDDQVDTGVLEVPPMLVQPFIENAIEHGIRHKNSTGLVTVEIKQEKGNLVIIIEDDGVGREKAKEIESSKYKEHQSMATQITRERLASLNRKLKNKVIFEIIDLKDQSGNGLGTRVNFTLPCSNQS